MYEVKVSRPAGFAGVAGLMVAAYVAAALGSQAFSLSAPDVPYAPVRLFTAFALFHAAAAAALTAVLTRAGGAGRLAWAGCAAFAVLAAGNEVYANQAISGMHWVLPAIWTGGLAALATALRTEPHSKLLRRVTIAIAAAQLAMALLHAGSGALQGAEASHVRGWLTETADLLLAAMFALSLTGVAGRLVLDRIGGAPTLVRREAEAHRKWIAPGFHACDVIGSAAHSDLDWSFVDASYCISLKEREDRTAEATAMLNSAGLAKSLIFYRPERHPTNSVKGIWESHCEVARHALAAGHDRIAIFEDDVVFDRGVTRRTLDRIRKAIERLPKGWHVFYLGHWPIRFRFLSPSIVHTRSACTHAYIASREMLEWMAASDFDRFRREHPKDSVVGRGIDDAFYRMSGAYALFPMIAIQSDSPSDHIPLASRGKIGRLRHLVTRTQAREWLLSRAMRLNEMKAAAVAALRWVVRI